MMINVDGCEVNFIDFNVSGNEIIVFLHGFTGSVNDWEEIINMIPSNIRAILFDFPGHGISSVKKELSYYTEEFIHRIINQISSKLGLNKFNLCGYSMGGRAALSYAVNYQNKINKLVLESSTAGIDDYNLRQERINSDEELCVMIEKKGVEYFINYWMNLPLFATMKSIEKRKYEEIVKSKLKNNPQGLVNSLKGFGTGKMRSLWHLLSSINIETLLISGELDKKFVEINRSMSAQIEKSKLEVVKNAGHNVHTEKPKEFAEILINFIMKKLF